MKRLGLYCVAVVALLESPWIQLTWHLWWRLEHDAVLLLELLLMVLRRHELLLLLLLMHAIVEMWRRSIELHSVVQLHTLMRWKWERRRRHIVYLRWSRAMLPVRTMRLYRWRHDLIERCPR
jgi:hypothetical protein